MAEPQQICGTTEIRAAAEDALAKEIEGVEQTHTLGSGDPFRAAKSC